MFELPGFQIVRELGRGGMSTVYVAVQLSLGREVALKVLAPQLATDPAFTERFLREGRIAASLHHSHIVAVYDVGTHEGMRYIAMEYLPRGRIAATDVPMAPRDALRCVREIASALDHAHARGIVHRDVKTANILRHEGGAWLLSDFGIARLNQGASTLTGEGSVVGTPGYMSPEQWHDQSLDGRADLYSLGIVLYELLTGGMPYTGADRWMIGMQHMGAALPELPAEYRMLQGLLARMLAKDPDDRFATGAEVVAHIESLEREGIVPDERAAFAAASEPSSAHTSRLMREWPHRAAARFFGPPTPPKLRQRMRARWWIAAAATMLALVVVEAWQLLRPIEPMVMPVAHSIAVLPFADMTQAHDAGYFADGMTDELLDLLAKVPGLHVAGRTSSFSFKGKNDDLASIGRKLHVATVLEGSVRKSGDRIRITAQLINVADGYHLWSETYDRQLTDVFAVQDDIAGSVVTALKIKLLSEPLPAPASRRKVNPDAYIQFLIGRQMMHNSYEGDPQDVASSFEKAIALDPGFAPAYAELAIVELMLAKEHPNDAGKQAEAFHRATVAADQALRLDPDLAAGYAARAMVRSVTAADYPGAISDYQRALAINPNEPNTLRRYAILLIKLGRLPEAIHATRKSIELDPLSFAAWNNLGYDLYDSGQYASAREACDRALEINPNNALTHYIIGMVKLHTGDAMAALAEFELLKKDFPETRLMGIAVAEHALGHELKSRQALNALIADPDTSPSFIAGVYATLGDRDNAFEWLERGYNQHSEPLDIMAEPLFANLRGDPRYPTLLTKMGLLSVSSTPMPQ